MITTIDLIRHPESEMNFLFPHLIGGRSNHSPLTEKGLWQAQQFGLRLKKENIIYDATYTSPAVRTSEMARIAHEISGAHPSIVIIDAIQEIHQGDWEGKPRADHQTPAVVQEIIAMKGHHKAPNGQSQRELEACMLGFAENCLDLHPGKRIAWYTHGVAIKCLLRYVQDWDHANTYHTEIDNTSISTIQYHHKINKWRMKRVNDTAHLTLL